jgi:anti-anti-sigma regulatory factor
MQIAEADSGRVLKLSGALRINVADEIRVALLDFVCTASRPVVDLSEVTECDAAGLQLLISASRTAERSATPYELVNVPGAVREAAAALGLPITALLPGRGSEDVV